MIGYEKPHLLTGNVVLAADLLAELHQRSADRAGVKVGPYPHIDLACPACGSRALESRYYLDLKLLVLLCPCRRGRCEIRVADTNPEA